MTFDRWRMQGPPFDPQRKRRSRGEQQARSALVLFWTVTGTAIAYVSVHIMWSVVQTLP